MATFTLPNKKVTLLPVVRKKSYMGVDDHDGSFLFTGAFHEWSIFQKSNGQYINPLNKTEQTYFEKLYNVSFNPDVKGNFWETFSFKIKKDTHDLKLLKYEFDLNKPKDYLAYKLLLTAPNVAPTWNKRNDTPEYKWVLVDKDEPVQLTITRGEQKAACYKWLMENTNKVSELKDVLYVMNEPIDIDMTKDEIKATFINIIENKRKMPQLYETINDEELNVKVILSKGLKSRNITIKHGKYYLQDGTQIGVTKQESLEWIGSEANSDKVAVLKANIAKSKL